MRSLHIWSLLPLAAVSLVAAEACSPTDEAVPGAGGKAAPDAEARADDLTPDQAAALAAAQAVLTAINTRDADLLRAVMAPDALIVASRPGAGPAPSTLEEMAALVADPPQVFVERMWDARVHADGPIAAVWAPYDFYRDGAFSHCGVDAFHLVRVDGAWLVQSLVYNTGQPPGCVMHPEGPPEP